jgi:hypothetical protein
VKFTIEIYATDALGAATLLHRASMRAINPLGARKEAVRLLAVWKRRKANTAHILNAENEIIYSWTE